MFYASLQRTELQIVYARFDERVDSLLEQIEKGELITGAGFVRDVNQRNGNRRRGWSEVRNNFLVTDHLQDITNRLG